ncbi:uncharacterized protein LOC135225050 [Macrobrachium nipponense]|uniref:uncharacterized protein LOC135225050 n=1 Tax=Macrobrachium nipponense TaxID=159736 RepID=UPI0030C88480
MDAKGSSILIDHYGSNWVTMGLLSGNMNENLDWKARYLTEIGFQALIILRASGLTSLQKNTSFASAPRSEPVHKPEVTRSSKTGFEKAAASREKDKNAHRRPKTSVTPSQMQQTSPDTPHGQRTPSSGCQEALQARMTSPQKLETLADSSIQMRPTDSFLSDTKGNDQLSISGRARKSKLACQSLLLRHLKIQSTGRLIQKVRERAFTEKSTKYWRLQTKVW